MRKTLPENLERARIRDGEYGSDASAGMAGAFMIQGPKGAALRIISSGPDLDSGWEHVSVSIEYRTPNWAEMCFVKALFWDADECVVQYHPPQVAYVNHHPHCLHLWRPMDGHIRTPPADLVGPLATHDA